MCVKCNQYKNEEEFSLNKEKWFRKFRERICKDCKIKQYHKRRLQNRGDQGLERLLTERYSGLKLRAVKRGLIVDFDRSYLKELWIKQKGVCAISGVEMSATVFNGRTFTNLSVDRIDSTKGYLKNNVQLVCMAVNQMKSDLTNEELLFFCKKIVENEEKNNNY